MSSSKLSKSAESSKTADDSSSGRKRSYQRKVTLAACSTCRTKKAACDGARPQCGRCIQRGFDQPCIYATEGPDESRGAALKRQNESLRQRVQELEGLLIRGNEAVAANSTYTNSAWTPASGGSPDHANMQYKASPSPATMFSILPQVSSSLESELMARHPMVYHPFDSFDFQSISANFAKITALVTPLKSGRSLPQRSDNRDGAEIISADTEQPRAILRGFDPVRPPIYCDWRLERLQISHWTSVPGVSNDFAARLFSWYLETDHPILGFFDADLFLDDLISQRPVFCSSLLVNAVLCWACKHAYTAFDDRAGQFRVGFYTRAWDCWMKDSAAASAVTASAGLFLNLILSSNGKDALAKAVLHSSYKMAEDLDMFGSPPDITSRVSQEEIDNRKAWSHLAWGLFNHATQRAFTYQDYSMKRAPKFGIPGNGGVIAHDQEGKAVYHKLPRYVSLTFTHLCRLWMIGNKVVLNYWNEFGPPPGDRVSPQWAEEVLKALLTWADETKEHNADGQPTPHHCDIFHIYFHSIVLDLLRPFLRERDGLAENTIQTRAIFSASVRQLQYRILLHPITHQQARTSLLWSTALLEVGNAAINDLSNPESWFYFLLCLSRYQDLADHFPIMTDVVRGFLAMSIARKALSVADAKQLQWRLQGDGLNSGTGALMQGSWILDLDRGLVDPKAATMQALAEAFEVFKNSEEGNV